MKRILIFIICFFATITYANKQLEQWIPNSHLNLITDPADRWSFIAVMGLSSLDQVQGSDSIGFLTRIALHGFVLNNSLAHRYWGFEIGLQSGLGGNIAFPQAQIDSQGGTIQANTRASFDFLGSVVKEIDTERKVFGVINFGGMFRQLFFNLGNIQMRSEIDPELEVGISKHVHKGWELGLLYQGVYSHRMRLNIDASGRGTVNSIPSQNGVLFSIYGRV